MSIEILEEALCIKSVLSDEFGEIFSDAFHICQLNFCSCRSSIDNVCATKSNFGVNRLLKTFLSENFIDMITELSPFNVSTFFGCFISIA